MGPPSIPYIICERSVTFFTVCKGSEVNNGHFTRGLPFAYCPGKDPGVLYLNAVIHLWWEKKLPSPNRAEYLLKGVPSHVSASLTNPYHLQLLILVRDVGLL